MGLKNWIAGAVGRVRAQVRRFAGDARGNVAMITGLAMPVLILMTMGGIDIHRIATVRVNLQDALDAAALAAARSPYVTDEDLKDIGWPALRANLAAYPDITVTEEGASFTLVGERVVADADIEVKTIAAHIFMPPYGWYFDDKTPVSAHSEVDRSSRDLEVALVLDITGSMSGSAKIGELKKAAKQLVDLIIQPVQTPYYSKVALVPYSMAVNAGPYVSTARGGVSTSVDITNATINLTGDAKTITGATKDDPVVVTAQNHGFSNNDVVWITGVSGMTQLNNKAFLVKNKTANTFQLYSLNGRAVDGDRYSSHTGNSGRVQKCQDNDCSITITAAGHGLRNNDYVRITDVNGMTQINDKTYLVGNVQTNSFTVDPDASALTPYTSGGRAWCAQAGCTWFAFENVSGDLQTHKISGCVTERTGADAYTDATPSTGNRVGRHYPNTNGSCLGNPIEPLTADAAGLKDKIDAFNVDGSTAGQIGIGWGWYMVSPNFNSLWPSHAAAPYNTARTLKAVVIMTDGEFNTPYCGGVVPDNWGGGVYNQANRIDCDAAGKSYADPFDQSEAMCAAMKARGVVVYTVGFQINQRGDAADLLSECASTPGNFFLPQNGGDLSEAFAAIGRDITKLRITK